MHNLKPAISTVSDYEFGHLHIWRFINSTMTANVVLDKFPAKPIYTVAINESQIYQTDSESAVVALLNCML